MKILGIELNHSFVLDGVVTERTSGVDYFRIIQPLTLLRKHTGWDVDIWKSSHIFSHDCKNWDDITKKYDVIFTGYNVAKPEAYVQLMVMAKRNNCKVIFDLDDDLWNIHEDNHVYERFHKGTEDLEIATAILRDVGHLVVTQKNLKDTVVAHTGRPSEQTYVIDNYIDTTLYNPKKQMDDDRVTLFYSGSRTHVPDVYNREFLLGVDAVMREFSHVHLLFIGMFCDVFAKYGDRYEVVEGETDFMKFVPLWNFYVRFADIGVVPLEDNKFNSSKSSLKYLEYAAARLPVVASNVFAYRNERRSGAPIPLVKEAREWYEAIRDLVVNPQLRHNLGGENYEHIRARRSEAHCWKNYQELFEKIALDKQIITK
ncbi:MAG TPA: glycosyltransferase [Candidatus Woesebacteria bacterium]|nr:glycosyltransferase [Candidatus Woesebacteria bacterium]